MLNKKSPIATWCSKMFSKKIKKESNRNSKQTAEQQIERKKRWCAAFPLEKLRTT
jgi:uncharacterized protein YceK